MAVNDKKPFRFRFFLPKARLLTENEIASLPSEKRQSVEGSETSGLWLEIACPDSSCIDEHGNITVPTEAGSEQEGLFVSLFCPQGSCKIEHSTDLP